MQGITVNPGDSGNVLLGKMGSAFRRWCRLVKKIEIPPCTWNLHWIGRGDNDKKNYPELDSNVKAAHTKPILFFLCEVAKEISSKCESHSAHCWHLFWKDIFQQKWGNRFER